MISTDAADARRPILFRRNTCRIVAVDVRRLYDKFSDGNELDCLTRFVRPRRRPRSRNRFQIGVEIEDEGVDDDESVIGCKVSISSEW